MVVEYIGHDQRMFRAGVERQAKPRPPARPIEMPVYDDQWLVRPEPFAALKLTFNGEPVNF